MAYNTKERLAAPGSGASFENDQESSFQEPERENNSMTKTQKVEGRLRCCKEWLRDQKEKEMRVECGRKDREDDELLKRTV